ncbi:MAG: hypothetical protein DMG25_00750, partial [Acidobacteria bacterium]
METISRTLLTVLINSLWQVALVAAVGALCARLTRSAPARFEHVLWVMALALGVLLPASSALRGARAGPALARASAAAVAARVTTQRPVSPVRAATPGDLPPLANRAAVSPEPRGRSSYPWLRLGANAGRRARPVSLPPFSVYGLLSAYLLFLLYRLIRLAQAWTRTDQIRDSAYPRRMPDPMASVVTRCQAALGLRGVSILGSAQISGPLTLGIRRAAIVLPEGMFQSTSPQELTAALCHEMAHIRRHDFLMNLVYELALLPLSFHPAARLIKRRIDETRELACDEMAARRIVNAASYARSLVSLARAMSSLPARRSLAGPGYTLSVFDANILEERIMRLLDKRPRPSAGKAKMSLATGFLLLAATCAAAFAFSLTVAVSTKAAVDESTVRANFSGRWELDKTRSDLPSPSPDGFVQVIELDDPHLRITTTSKDWTAAEARAGRLVRKPIAITLFALTIPEFSVNTDNRETIQKYGPGQLRSKTRWEGDNLVTDWTLEWTLERDGQAVVIGTWVRSLSSDGQIQTVEVKARDLQRGAEGKATLVFVKRSSGEGISPSARTAFLGIWEGKLDDVPGVTITLEPERAGLGGTVVFYKIQNAAGTATVVGEDEEQIANTRLEGSVLTFDVTNKEGVFVGAGNHGDTGTFKMELTGEDEAALRQLRDEESDSTPVRLHRSYAGGPSGGVIGGILGGLGPGVPGGVITPGVPGGVADRVPGGVEGDTVPGAPRDDTPPSVFTISGTVYDASGARVPEAIVVVSNLNAKVRKTVATDEEGSFRFEGLPEGRYQLQVSKPGFALYQQRGVVLDASKPAPE